MKKLQEENVKLFKENNHKRNVSGYVKDKAKMKFLHEENKELKKKVSTIGRNKITDSQIRHIIDLFKRGLSYGDIAEKTGLGKSTTYKYVNLYQSGRLDLNE